VRPSGAPPAGVSAAAHLDAFDPGNRLIAALDVPDRGAADALLARLGDAPGFIKIGLELFIAEGPELVRAYVGTGRRIMLDLKLHDIPATVARACARVAGLGVELITVHAAGGRDMLRAAADAVAGTATRLLAVTVLTSMDPGALAEVGVAVDAGRAAMGSIVLARAHLAAEAGCHGVVASPLEAAALRAAMAADFLLVTPGVRPAGTDPGDQKRVATPARARQSGADLIVCGRPIRDAADPGQVARDIIAEIAAAGGQGV
jgi:orotidine-5'-phosphate decarboxylase